MVNMVTHTGIALNMATWQGLCLPREWYFTDYWLENFEIRVGESDVIGNNDICYKQLVKLDIAQTNLTCSRALYGNWVSVNQSGADPGEEDLVLAEIRVFGSSSQSKYISLRQKWVHPDSKVHGPTWGPAGTDRTQLGPM